MISLYIAIVIILVAFLVSNSMNQQQRISTKSICVICDGIFPEENVFEQDGLTFCQQHFITFKNSEWGIVESCECSPGQEQESVELYNKKNTDFKNGVLGFLKPSYREVNGTIITTLDYYQKKSLTK